MDTELNIVGASAVGTEARLDRTFWEARNLIDRERLVVVEVTTVGGPSGVSTVSASDMKSTIRAIELFGRYAAGRYALDIAAVWQHLFDVTAIAPGAVADHALLSALKALPETALLAAVAAIDLALWDLKGKVLKQPVWRLAGGYRDHIECYATGGYYLLGQTTHDPAAQVESALNQGYTAYKMKLGGLALADDLARLASARRVGGDATRIMIDANRSYSLQRAEDAIGRFEAFDPYWFEEPLLPSETLAALGRLSRHTRVPLASGESEVQIGTCVDQIAMGGVEIMQFDATRFGGATGWLKLAAYAELTGARMATHHNWHIHAHLAAAVPNGHYVEVHPDVERTVLVPQIVRGNPPIINGRITLDDTPGFGFEIDWQRVEQLRIA